MPHTVAENLTRLVNAKTAIGNAITAKGGTVASGDGLEEFPADIATIPSGSSPKQPVKSGATIYDFDGTVIETYSSEEFAALTEYPAHPTHEYLTADGYNWTLANAKAYSAKYGYVEVGAQYRATDGKTRLFITLGDGRLEPQLGLGINGSVDVDWGDGSAHNTMTGSAVNTTVYQVHKYAQAGDYIITLTVTGSMQFNGTNGYGYILGTRSENSNTNKTYLNALKKLYIGDSVTSIGGNAFYNCSALQSVSTPDSVTSIGGNAFYNCRSLQSVSIPDSVTSMGGYTFYNCSALQSVSIPDSVTSMGGYTFYNCSALQSVSIPDSVTSIGGYTFYNCYALQSVSIPDSVTSIGSNVFFSCYELQSVSIPDSVTSIGGNAFQYCYTLQSVSIPDSVTSMGGYAFQNCYGLSSVIIPSSVTSIGGNAFYNCYGLGFVVFKGTTTVPTVANVNAWSNVPTDCYILVPFDYLDDYLNTTNMPDDSTYLYLCYATYADGATLPTVDGDGYTLTWYASREDARAKTNPISVGNGKEIYARGVEQ